MEKPKGWLMELPADIDKMTDEELRTLAHRIYTNIMGTNDESASS